MRNLKAAQFPEDAGPLAHPVRPGRYIEINNFYTATVYNKGAEVVRMLQTLLGREGFRKGMDLYFERHDGQAATVEDFVTCFEDATGRDLAQFMTWYSQAGTPELVCQLKYDARNKTADLTIAQVLPPTPGEAKKKPLHVPVRLGLLGGNGQDIDLTLASGKRLEDGVIELTKRTETYRFRDVPSRPVPSLLRGFSAPVNLTIALSDADLQFLMANDSDLYNRWQAAQDYATRVLVEAVKALRAGKRPEKPQAHSWRRSASASATRASIPATAPSSCSCRARATSPASSPATWTRSPSTTRARSCARPSAPCCYETLAETYRRHEVKGPYSPAPDAAGKRALRNAALGYLASRGKAEDVARLAAHFAGARNATDEVSALVHALRAALAGAGQGLRPLLRALEG